MEERAGYATGRKKPTTFRELRAWLDRLRPDQLDAAALVAIGNECVVVAALATSVDPGDWDPECKGPVLLTQEISRGQSSTEEPFAP